ncbi:MAG: transporter substrate-binding domain-containing protein [Liquorilactobacillus ghanensis]|jgi:polar amino acid transport system substrate-binding protein|uniref:ABC transporter substrate-binding protein n=1 Tax=Liquorilactobacillus ghanensis DSM 18630 TaxID=1423750 RepID=A0A0R1VL62_9LACO|nr:transporter substrate-binding domain-containing protein [Liquorilactobacillus ghanensis]KRM06069.1 ABC transporter substrate-binding protein [Liquorilactobacillus ghanensis DSM 18630]
MKRKSWYKVVLSLLVVGLIFLAAGCSNSSSKTNEVKKIQNRGTLVIGTSADFAPFEFPVVQNGQKKIIGYDILLAQKIAKNLGVKLKIENVEFSSLISELKDKKVDMIISGLSVTKQRKKSISFSEPYYTTKNVLLVRKADKNKYDSLNQLAKKNIGVQQGSTQQAVAKKKLKKSNLVVESVVTSLATELKGNKLDGVLVEGGVAEGYVSKYPDQYAIASVKMPIEKESQSYSVGIDKSNQALVKRVNTVISKLKKDGTDKKMFDQAKQLQQKYNK